MSTPEEAYQTLTKAGFKVEDKRPEREYFICACMRCGNRWSLGIKDGKVHGGNLLTLLDHSASHTNKKGPTRE